jgi:hypothetical protein
MLEFVNRFLGEINAVQRFPARKLMLTNHSGREDFCALSRVA